MRTLRAELHVHTALSPCAEVEMIPPLIVQEALERGIQLLAITDHNASANANAVMAAAQGTGLTVLPGMELQTQEEVHLLCLFDTLEQIDSWQAVVDQAMPRVENNVEYFGEQFVVDETGDFLRRENRLLLTSAEISFDEAVRMVTDLGGLAIPAHVDRKVNGLFANLGFVPPDVNLDGMEISRRITPQQAAKSFPQTTSYTLVQGGDAHRLDELLGANELTLESPSVEEIRMALRGERGRAARILQSVQPA